MQDMEFTKAPEANLATASRIWKITVWVTGVVAAVLLILAATLV